MISEDELVNRFCTLIRDLDTWLIPQEMKLRVINRVECCRAELQKDSAKRQAENESCLSLKKSEIDTQPQSLPRPGLGRQGV